MIFPLVKTWLAPCLPSLFGSSSNNKAYKSPGSGFVTIGGGGAASSRGGQGAQSACHVSVNRTFDNESEENIVKGSNGVKLRHMNAIGGARQSLSGIVVLKQVSVTTENKNRERTGGSFQPV
jgi:hypothetical protein